MSAEPKMKLGRDESLPRRIATVVRKSKRPGEEPWEQTWNGLTWVDMPNLSREHKLLDFALYRRGMYEVEFDLSDETDEADETDGAEVTPKKRRMLRSSHCFGKIGVRRKVAAAVEARAVVDDLPERLARQVGLITRYVAARAVQVGFVKAFYNLDCTAHSALARAMGKGRGIQGALRVCSLDRIERAFESLSQGGWKV